MVSPLKPLLIFVAGGMNDALWRLSRITGDAQWQETAAYFNHWSWTAPLSVGEDDLSGNHGNTQCVASSCTKTLLITALC